MKHEFQSNVLNSGQTVLKNEADALYKFSESIPEDFPRVVHEILKCTGRVIVSGVGKSGHVGRKIAATLASTGTPASFVHASEASHGDLGMITQNDFCILVSNSGETSELKDLIAHTRRFGIKMAAISSREKSTLIQSADFRLVLPEFPEACAIGMAPTTSTTMTMALGDALAVSLMQQRKFRVEDFGIFHPGGKLGAQMSTVGQLMRAKEELAIVAPETKMQEVVLKMTESGYGICIVQSDLGEVSGIITDGDLRRHISGLFELTAADIATSDPVSVKSHDLVVSVVKKMQERKTYSILVLEDRKPIGLLRMHDVLRAGLA